ncbi:MAG: DNA cytosine methyltransferase [Anaerolineae bacterium]|nr:DNA cytosine methyltransferase [Anaerolineae bacterium]
MHELALFAGAGGGLLATKWLLGWRTVCYVENATYPVKVLKARIKDNLLDDAPIWGNVRTFDGHPWRGCVDIITAGFPCQPFSRAGKGLAEQDNRNLWPDTIRIIREVRPRWVLLENVPRLLSHAYARRIFGDLAQSRYDCRWDCIPASAIGANHQRDRLWIVAYANGGGFQEHAQLDCQSPNNTANRDSQGRHACGRGDKMADADCKRPPQRKAQKFTPDLESTQRQSWWQVEPDVGRVVDGLPKRVDRLKALGNAQVPAVVAAAWELLKGQR